MSAARVVLVMPVYNEAKHLRTVLHSLQQQDFDHARLYFVGVDGASTDASAQILRDWLAESDIDGRIVYNPRRNIPSSLNAGIAHACGADIVARLDAHTVYARDYLSKAIGALENAPPDVACVGSAPIPAHGATFGERVVESLYTNPVGLGGGQFRFGNDVREVDQAYLPVWRPGVLQRAGAFNERLDANEDAEMAARIRALGLRIFRVPLPCRFIINKGPAGSIRQWHRYGYWRARMLLRNPRSVRPRHAASLAASMLAAGLAVSPLRAVLVPMCAGYAALVLRGRPAGEAPAVTLAALVYFPIVQFAYSAGMLRGLLATAPQPRSRRA